VRTLVVLTLAWLSAASSEPRDRPARSLPRAGPAGLSGTTFGVAQPKTEGPALAWMNLAPGIEYATVTLEKAPGISDGRLHIVRIIVGPFRGGGAAFNVKLASLEGQPRTAGAWADKHGFVAVINAGMYQTDGRTNVGFLRDGQHVNNPRWNAYQSVLALSPYGAAFDRPVPNAVILDRDAPGFAGRSAEYATLVQNLRLIKAPGVNVWQANGRRWSEAAIAMTRQGRILFLFTRTPYEMIDFNRRLLALPLDIVSAMHVEGGPEASLSIRAPGLKLDLAGSFETGFRENDGNGVQWALPNVIGVREGR
jgi:hypothetical protein